MLAGDYLFAQSCALLAKLESLEVIKLVSQVVGDFADGEISQRALLFKTDLTLEDYLDKSFYKTASLIAGGSRCAAMLSGCPPSVTEAMYQYGRQLGLAFQIMDDVLDYTQSAEVLGKPPGQDLRSGNITAPAHFALLDPSAGPELRQLIESRFISDDAHERALELIRGSDGIPRCGKGLLGVVGGFFFWGFPSAIYGPHITTTSPIISPLLPLPPPSISTHSTQVSQAHGNDGGGSTAGPRVPAPLPRQTLPARHARIRPPAHFLTLAHVHTDHSWPACSSSLGACCSIEMFT